MEVAFLLNLPWVCLTFSEGPVWTSRVSWSPRGSALLSSFLRCRWCLAGDLVGSWPLALRGRP